MQAPRSTDRETGRPLDGWIDVMTVVRHDVMTMWLRVRPDGTRRYLVRVDEAAYKSKVAASPSAALELASGQIHLALAVPPESSPHAVDMLALEIQDVLRKVGRALINPDDAAKDFPNRRPRSQSGSRFWEHARRFEVGQTAQALVKLVGSARKVVEEGLEPSLRFRHDDPANRAPSQAEIDVLLVLLGADAALTIGEISALATLARAKEGRPQHLGESTLTSRLIPVLKRRGWIRHADPRGFELTPEGLAEAKDRG